MELTVPEQARPLTFVHEGPIPLDLLYGQYPNSCLRFSEVWLNQSLVSGAWVKVQILRYDGGNFGFTEVRVNESQLEVDCIQIHAPFKKTPGKRIKRVLSIGSFWDPLSRGPLKNA